MKKRLMALFLAVCTLCGLTGCSEQVIEQAATAILTQEGDSFSTRETYEDDTVAVTMEAAYLADSAMAPMSASDDGTINAYFAASEDDSTEDSDYIYLDCISTVKNLTDEALNLDEEMYFYCVENDTLYQDHLFVFENEDGTKLSYGQPLESGESVRLHYAIILPADISLTDLKVHLLLPTGAHYTEPLEMLLPTGTDFAVDSSVTSESGAVLTLKSTQVVDEIEAVTEDGGNTTITPSTEGDPLVDIVIEVRNDGTESLALGTLYSSLWMWDSFGTIGSVMAETDGDIVYSTEIQSGSTVTTHVIFELFEDLSDADSFYLYLDGAYYPITVE